MSKEQKEKIELVAKWFFVWLIVICLTTIALFLIATPSSSLIISIEKKTLGSLCLTPQGAVLIIIFKSKRDVAILHAKREAKKDKQDYKLKQLKLKMYSKQKITQEVLLKLFK